MATEFALPKSVLAARVRLTIADAAAKRIDAFLGGLDALHRLAATAGEHELLVAPECSRATRLAAATGKPAWTMVLGPARASQFWDHTQRAYALLDAELAPRPRFAPPAGLAVTLGKADATLSFVDATLGPVRQRLRFAKGSKGSPFAQPLLEAVIGCADCHGEAGIPVAQLALYGLVERVETWLGKDDAPALVSEVEQLGVREALEDDFRPPKGYKPFDVTPRTDRKPAAAPKPAPRDPEPPGRGGMAAVGRQQQALESDLPPLTPECLPSTRRGAAAAIVRQALLDHVAMALNDLVPLAGTATLAGGTLTLPWLAGLGAAAPGAPGSGLFAFLRDPRTTSSGGQGLIDRLAWLEFKRADGAGKTLTQREFDAGTLDATLTSWGISAPTRAALAGAGGDFRLLTPVELIEVVEGYELSVWGTVAVGGLPATLPPPTPTDPAPVFTPSELGGLMSFRLTGIGGTAAFAAGSAPISQLDIGPSGNVIARFMLPRVTFTATVMRRLTALGFFLLIGGAAVLCAAFPLACPGIVLLATLLGFVFNNITALTLVATGVTVDFDLRWNHVASAQRVLPSVAVTGTGGTITVLNRWVTPNLIANLFDSLLLGFGNLFNLWVPLAAELARQQIQAALRKAGIAMPLGADADALVADAGAAVSAFRQQLVLFADVAARDTAQAQPYATQAATSGIVVGQLAAASSAMETGLNPAPTGPLDPIASAGCYLGLAYNQNALNQLLFRRWQRGEFGFDLNGTDAVKLATLLPPGFMPKPPERAHAWCAVAPRVELSNEGLMTGARALFVFLDDVRVCFEVTPSGGDAERPGGGVLGEISFNLKTPATLTLGWPVVSLLQFDLRPFEPSELRCWEITDTARPLPLPWPGIAAWRAFAEVVANALLTPGAAPPLAPLATPATAWPRPLPAVQEDLGNLPALGPLVNRMWLELLGGRRALYALPVLQSVLLQLVDGSGAPLLASLAGVAPPLTLGTMRPAQGTDLRKLLGFIPGSQLP